MEWIKKLFGKKKLDSISKPSEEALLPIPEVVVPEPNISEPVLSFVAEVLKNPSRFSLKEEHSLIPYYDGQGLTNKMYKFTDKKTKEVFEFYIAVFKEHPSIYSVRFVARVEPITDKIKWLTWEEKTYIYEEISYMLQQRKQKLSKLIEERQRKRLTKIYKGE